MTAQLKHDEVKNLLLSQSLQLMSNYTRTSDSVKVKCLQCKHIRSTNAGKLLYEVRKGNRPCPKCASVLSLSNESIDNRLIDIPIKRSSPYVSDSIPLHWECKICSHKWQTRATKILNEKTGCPKCSYANRNSRRKLTSETIARRLEGRNITLISPYINTTSHHRWKCMACSHDWLATPHKVLNEFTGCPRCAPDGIYGRKTRRGVLRFDSGLEAYCYDVITSFVDPDNIILQRRYPHNNRMRADFYIPAHKIWVEVSNIKTNVYRSKIENKRQAITQINEIFVFAESPSRLRSLLSSLIA